MKEAIWTKNPMQFAQNRIDSRQYILLPEIADMLQEEGAKSVLDYGCGEGYLFRNVLDKSIRAGLFDISETMLELAKNNAAESGFRDVSIYKKQEDIASETFDSVVLSLVLMTIEDDAEYLNVLSNCKRAMKKDGSLIIGITHPCFRQFLFSTHHTKFSLGSEYDYFKNNAPFDVYLRTSKSERFIQFEDFHHNLSYTFSKIKEAGLKVEDFIELNDKSIENSYYNKFFSPYIIIKCKNSDICPRRPL